MHRITSITVLVAIAMWHSPSVLAAPVDAAVGAKLVAEATRGQLKALKGKYFDKSCGSSVDYEAEVVDLNDDGQPEVFTKHYGSCFGMAGVSMERYIKGKDGKWKPQFGFPGEYTVNTKNLGYPDIEIGGPGNCFPVWRWNGARYDIYKKCGACRGPMQRIDGAGAGARACVRPPLGVVACLAMENESVLNDWNPSEETLRGAPPRCD